MCLFSILSFNIGAVAGWDVQDHSLLAHRSRLEAIHLKAVFVLARGFCFLLISNFYMGTEPYLAVVGKITGIFFLVLPGHHSHSKAL